MSVQHLYTKEAKDKIKEMAESIDFTMMITDLSTTPLHSFPMSTKKVDDFGSIWFLSRGDSKHNDHIRTNGKMQLIYNSPGSMGFLSIYGRASIHLDKVILEEFYSSTD